MYALYDNKVHIQKKAYFYIPSLSDFETENLFVCLVLRYMTLSLVFTKEIVPSFMSMSKCCWRIRHSFLGFGGQTLR